MWFPNNKPASPRPRCTRDQQLHNNTTPANPVRSEHVVTTRFPTPPRALTGPRGCGHRVTAVIAWGKRPVPSRTRKLRPTAPMVLHPGGCGRVGHRRTTITARPRHHVSGPAPFNGLDSAYRRPRSAGKLPAVKPGEKLDRQSCGSAGTQRRNQETARRPREDEEILRHGDVE
jgi:hypothetical protein